MSSALEFLSRLTPDDFQTVVSASPRPFREELLKALGVRKKQKTYGFSTGSRGESRLGALHEQLKKGESPGEVRLTELLRNYLYTKRKLLGDALEFFDVPHEDGLTSEDISFIARLESDKLAALQAHLEQTHDPLDIAVYLAYMNVSENA